MANYTAADVKKLRDLTGSGMMDCKKALEESDGDLDKAVELLRIKGAKDVGKRAERDTANGLVAADGRHDGRAELRDRLRGQERRLPGAGRPDPAGRGRPAAGRPRRAQGGPARRRHRRRRRAGAVRPDRREARAQALHPRRRPGRAVPAPPRLRPAAGHRRARRPTTGDGDAEAARGVAMHIAAARPRYTTRDEVPDDVLENERRDRRGHRPRGGQARAGAAAHRRGPDQRVLQGRRAARAGLGAGRQEDGQGAARRGRRHGHRSSPASRSARPEPGRTARTTARPTR